MFLIIFQIFILQRCPLIRLSTSSVVLWKSITSTSLSLIDNVLINFFIIFLTLNTNILSFLLIVIYSISKNQLEVYLKANKNLRSVPRHTKINYLYFCWLYLLFHSPSIEIAIIKCGNANICQLLYLIRMGALRRKRFRFKCIRPTFFLIQSKVYLNERLQLNEAYTKVFCFLTNFKC